jgi:hypothetical protein
VKYVTATVGAFLVFAGVGFPILFVAMRFVEEGSAIAQVMAMGSSVLIALLAAAGSFRATLRRWR